jgi:NitT/TauT family transport system substrate-binding protein
MSSRRRIRALALAAALVATTALAACGSHDDKASASGDASTIRLGYFPNITHAPALVGVNKGFFQDALGTTKLETKTFNAGGDALTALLSGAIDATYMGPNPAINGWAQTQGQGLKIIAGSTSGGAGLVVQPSITSAQDLKGKKVATPQLGNTQDVALRAWLKGQGLTTNTEGGGDVSITPQANSAILQGFAQGSLSGAWVPEPYLSQLVLQSKGKLLVDEKTLWPQGQFVTTQLVVTQSFLKKYPDTVKKLLQGQLKAIDYIASNKADAQAAANAQIATLSGKPLKDNVLQASFSDLSFTNDPIASSLYTGAQHAEAVGLLKTVDLKGIYDLGPLNSLLAAAGKPAVSDAAPAS